jgi:peptidoglycan hydrolase CwlO-like protein
MSIELSNWLMTVVTALIFLVGLVVAVKDLKKDNRKSNEEILNKALEDQKDFLELKSKVNLLENKIQTIESSMSDMKDEWKEDINEIKGMIKDIYDRLNARND